MLVTVKPWSRVAHSCWSLFQFLQHEAAISVFISPGQGASPSQVTPLQYVRFPKQLTSTHLYTWVERGTVRVKCLAQEHNTMSPARARTRITWSADEPNNHEATVPPTMLAFLISLNSSWLFLCTVFSLDLLDESQTKLSSDLLDSRQSISQIQVHYSMMKYSCDTCTIYQGLPKYSPPRQMTNAKVKISHYGSHSPRNGEKFFSFYFIVFLYKCACKPFLFLCSTDWLGKCRGEAVGCRK